MRARAVAHPHVVVFACVSLFACVWRCVFQTCLSGNEVEEVLWDKYGITLEDMAAAGCVPPPAQLLSLRMTESEYVPETSPVLPGLRQHT